MIPSPFLLLFSQIFSDGSTLANRVERLNPRWNEVDPETWRPPNADARFLDAVHMCGEDFCAMMTVVVECDMPTRNMVEHAFLDRFRFCPTGQIMVLEQCVGKAFWRPHLYELERQRGAGWLVKFVLYRDFDGTWRASTVARRGKRFQHRLLFPPAWCSLRDHALEVVSGIPGARFVHTSGFMAGACSLDAALAMALKTLDMRN
jgi:uncharacterized UPF0160 family protein